MRIWINSEHFKNCVFGNWTDQKQVTRKARDKLEVHATCYSWVHWKDQDIFLKYNFIFGTMAASGFVRDVNRELSDISFLQTKYVRILNSGILSSSGVACDQFCYAIHLYNVVKNLPTCTFCFGARCRRMDKWCRISNLFRTLDLH